MAEYIEREKARKAFNLWFGGVSHSVIANNILGEIPAADVVEGVHGEWIEKQEVIPWCEDDVDVFYECSVCGNPSCGESPYCPNYGAKMDGGKNNAAD